MVDATVLLEVGNTRVLVREAPDFALWRLNDRLAFMSDAARELGMEQPRAAAIEEEVDFHWDGMVRFLRRPKPRRDGSCAPPWFETGLLDRAMRALGELGLAVRVTDFRRAPDANEDVPLFWPKEPLFDYQEAAVSAGLRAGRGVIVAAPRAGKTRILLELIRRLGQPTLLIAPTDAIVEQTVRAALAYGYPEADVVKLEGPVNWDRVKSARIWLCTAARVMTLEPEQARTRCVVVCDECHHFTKGASWGRTLHKLFEHVFHWYGSTGTYFRSGCDDMALEAFLSGVVFEISSAELLGRGRLVPARVAFVPVTGCRVQRGQDLWRDGILLQPARNALVAACALHLAQAGRRVLVLVGQKAQGRSIAEMILAHAPAQKPPFGFAEFLYRGRGGVGAKDAEFRRRLIDAFLSGASPRVLLGTSLLGEGVDLPDADALVWARGGKAEVTLVQSFYRVVTSSPGKRDALIVDFGDKFHPTLLAASLERLRVVCDDPVFTPSVLPGPEHLAAWAAAGPTA